MSFAENLRFELRRSRRPPGHLGKDPDAEDFLAMGSGRRLLCAACRDPITTDEQRITIDGRHAHLRTNPAGFDFEFGCFSEAPGAAAAGEAIAEHSWFAGFRWRFSICRGCGCHLGWRFESGSSSFHGLILDRLEAEKG